MVDLLRVDKTRRAVAKVPGVKYVYRWVALPVLKGMLKTSLAALDYKYCSAGLISSMNPEFMNDPKFKKAYAAGIKQWPASAGGQWAFHLNFWAAHHAKHLDGDFVECGVFRAKGAMANITYLQFETLKKKYYLFDTFQGLDPKYSSAWELDSWKGHYPDTYAFVKKSFKKYKNVIVVKGSVPKTLSTVPINKVAYLHLDMNAAKAERAALEYFWPKMTSGGIIILDDYAAGDLENNVHQKRAHDAFAASVGVSILTFPSGQGVIIKP